MISFLLNVFRLLRAIYIGIIKDQEFRALFFLLGTLLLGSTIFYAQFEAWSYLDALYFSVMTMSTIGYGDFVPTTNFTKIFTIIFSFISTSVFVAINAKIVMIIVNRKQDKRR